MGVVDNHEPLLEVKQWQYLPEMFVDGIFDDFEVRDCLLLERPGEPAVEIKPYWFLHFATTEFDLRSTARDGNLVDHVP